MGRARAFEDDRVLEKAIHVFWEKGYEQSSLKDLLTAMDILNGSFYHSYGNKKTLFLKALDVYYRGIAQKREDLFATSAPFQEKIRAVFHRAYDRDGLGDVPKGCLLVNTLSADILAEEDVKALVLRCKNDFEAFLKRQIETAQSRGEIDASLDSATTAAVLSTFFQGLLRLCSADFPESGFREQTEFFLSALKL